MLSEQELLAQATNWAVAGYFDSPAILCRIQSAVLAKRLNPQAPKDFVLFNIAAWKRQERPNTDLYNVVLHEFGHLLHPQGLDENKIISEAAAWVWAIEASRDWDSEATRNMMAAFKTYAHNDGPGCATPEQIVQLQSILFQLATNKEKEN